MDAAGRELIEDEESRKPKDGHVARVHMAGVGCATKSCGRLVAGREVLSSVGGTCVAHSC